MMDLNFIISNEYKFFNVKEVLKEKFQLSDRLIKKLKLNKQIFLNNNSVSPSFCDLKIGDIVSVDLNFIEESENIVPTELDLNIIYEDDYLLVINKSPNMPVHPSINHFDDTLSNGVKYYFDSIGLKRKIRIVNRLDKDTSRYSYFCKKRIYSRMFNPSNEKSYI